MTVGIGVYIVVQVARDVNNIAEGARSSSERGYIPRTCTSLYTTALFEGIATARRTAVIMMAAGKSTSERGELFRGCTPKRRGENVHETQGWLRGVVFHT